MIALRTQPFNEPEPHLCPVKEAIRLLYDEMLAHAEAALFKAIIIGGKLVVVQKDLKQQRRYGDWIDATLPFSKRTASDYVTLFHNRELIEHESNSDRLSIRAALKFIRDAAKAVEPRALEVCPCEIDVVVEEVEPQEEEARLADREILLVEADSGLIGEFITLLRAAKRAGKNVKFQQLGAFDTDVPLDRPFDEILRRPVPEPRAARAKNLPPFK